MNKLIKSALFLPIGSLDLDSSPQTINTKSGTYRDCLNVSKISLVTKGDQRLYAVNGNSLAITPPTIVTQDKIYQISFENSTGLTVQIQFLNLNGSQFLIPAITSSFITTGNLATDSATFLGVISGALTASGFTNNVTIVSPGVITVQIISNPRDTGFDYQIVSTNINTLPLNIITIQESWDKSVAGICYPTGSKDWLDDLFIMSSSVGQDPMTFTVVGTQTSLGGDVQINVVGNILPFLDGGFGSYVSVQGVQGTTEANGQWINSAASFNVISPGNTTLTLFNSTYANAYTSGGTLTVFIYGFFNMSVSQYAIPTKTWTTYNLLQTKSINSRWNHPFRDEDADSTDLTTNIYFTDNFDHPHIFSYTGAYLNNGAIQFYNPDGLYTYEDVEQDTRNIIGTLMPLVKITNFTDSGGAIPSGNWRYTVSLQNSDLTTTGTGIFTNPINIYNGSFGAPSQILGTPGDISSMTVTVTVSEIPQGFSYINLIGINYVGDAEVAYLIKTVAIPSNATSMHITHTGLEQGIENYGASFTLSSLAYVKAGTQVISNNTLLYADLTTAAINDYTAVSQTFTHILGRDTTSLLPTGDDRTGYTVGEYQAFDASGLPATPSVTGYMLNETYRFWACYELKSGVFTPLFWIDDIRFDLFGTNVANPFNQTTRRTGNNIPDYDLSSSPGSISTQDINSYVFYLTFQSSGIANFLVDGVPFSDLVERIHFFRTDNTTSGTSEVLGCGVTVRHVAGTANDNGSPQNYIIGYPGVGAANFVFENPFMCVDSLPATDYLPNTDQGAGVHFYDYSTLFAPGGSFPIFQYGRWNSVWGYGGSDSIMTANTPYSCSWYCPDNIYGQIAIDFRNATDTILNYGQPDWNIGGSTGTIMDASFLQSIPNPTTGTYITGVELRLSGSTHISTDAFSGSANLGLQQATPVGTFAGNINSIGSLGLTYCSGQELNVQDGNVPPLNFNMPDGIYTWNTPEKLWLYTDTPFPSYSLFVNNPDIGTYYCQYYRPIGNAGQGSSAAATNAVNYPDNTKFGAITTGLGIPCGASVDISEATTTISIDIYGGDTFTQKSFLKLRYPDVYGNNFNLGGGNTIVFFCQNRMNFNMRNPGVLAYPSTPPIDGWINDDSTLLEIDDYDKGYTPRNPDNTLAAFNPELPNQTYYPNRKIFSDTKPQGSTINNYKVFPPLNFNDDQTNEGIITALLVIENELYGLHPKGVWRYFYNDVGTFQGEGTGDVTLASGAPFSKPAILLSNNGCSNIFSVIQGKGLNGEDIACWIDIINKKVMMLSKGGVRDLTVENNMRSWFEDNLNTDLQDVPILQHSISSVFDEKRKEFIWTVYDDVAQYGTVPLWDGSTDYVEGDLVYNDYTFEGLQQVYLCTQANIDILPQTGAPYWEALTYKTYTIAYSLYANGGKGGFSTFYTPLPYFYAQWKNTYLSAYPNVTTNPFNGIYIHDVGSILTWYLYNATTQTETGYFEYVSNELIGIMKVYQSIQVSSLLSPFEMVFNTQDQSTEITEDEFRKVINLWLAAIPNDTSIAPPTELWNSKLYGEYMVNGIFFEIGAQQWVDDMSNKYRLFLPDVLT